jgi:hypothetical protein
VTETINDVITACLTPKSPTSMERTECDNAIHEMETSKGLLQQPVLQPCTTYTYFDTLDHVVDNSKRLGEAMTHIASAAKNTNHELFIQAVQDASRAVCRLIESSAQVSSTFSCGPMKLTLPSICRRVTLSVFLKRPRLKERRLYSIKYCSIDLWQLFDTHVRI